MEHGSPDIGGLCLILRGLPKLLGSRHAFSFLLRLRTVNNQHYLVPYHVWVVHGYCNNPLFTRKEVDVNLAGAEERQKPSITDCREIQCPHEGAYTIVIGMGHKTNYNNRKPSSSNDAGEGRKEEG